MKEEHLSDETMKELQRTWDQKDLLEAQERLEKDPHPFSADEITVKEGDKPPRKLGDHEEYRRKQGGL